MSSTIDLQQAQQDLSRLVADLESGAAKEFLILRDGHPVARLIALSQAATIDEEKERARDLLTGA